MKMGSFMCVTGIKATLLCTECVIVRHYSIVYLCSRRQVCGIVYELYSVKRLNFFFLEQTECTLCGTDVHTHTHTHTLPPY